MTVTRVPLPDLADQLGRRADALVRWLGLRGSRVGRHFVALNPTRGDREPGSFRIVIVGGRAGRWIDYATNEFGDPLDLIAYIRHGGRIVDAIADARSFLGLPDSAIPGARIAPDGPRDVSDDEARMRVAKAIWLSGDALQPRCPVDLYLQGRGIHLSDLGRAPRALRYHAACYCKEAGRKLPAMVAAITRGGVHVATHRTYLAHRDGRWRKADLKDAKMAIGIMAGGHISLWRGASRKPLREAAEGDVVAIAEGIETALSVAVACPELRVLSAINLGGLGRVALPPQIGTVILCADNDEGRTDKPLEQAAQRYLAEGREVRIAAPAVPGADWNDILQGVEG